MSTAPSEREKALEAARRILDYWDVPAGRMPRAPHSQDEVTVAKYLLSSPEGNGSAAALTTAPNPQDIHSAPATLLPCPFDVGDILHKVRLRKDTNAYLSPHHFAVICRCGASGPNHSSPDAAIAFWNNRASALRSPKEIL